MNEPDTIYTDPEHDFVELTDGKGRVAYDRRRTCVWSIYDSELSIWSTECGHPFQFPNGDGPVENMFGWCQYCGGEIEGGQDDAT